MLVASFDPLSGLPTKKAPPKGPALGPGPAEPKNPFFGYPGSTTRTTARAPGDPVGADPTTTAATTGVPAVASAQDLENIINSDPLYKQAQADIQAARIGDQASRTAARQRALILYGDVPDLSQAAGALGLVGGDLGGDITDTVRQLAAQSTSAGLSTVGRLQRAHSDAVQSIKDQLTARGILSSGETGYQLGRQNDALQQSQYDALQQLVDYLAGVQGSYLSNEQARLAALRDARVGASGRVDPNATAPPTDPLSTTFALPTSPDRPDSTTDPSSFTPLPLTPPLTRGLMEGL